MRSRRESPWISTPSPLWRQACDGIFRPEAFVPVVLASASSTLPVVLILLEFSGSFRHLLASLSAGTFCVLAISSQVVIWIGWSLVGSSAQPLRRRTSGGRPSATSSPLWDRELDG